MKLSRTDIDILAHRMECPENIAECVHGANVADTVVRLLASLRDTRSLPASLSALEKSILADAINGSTFATVWDDESREHRNAVRSGRSLASRLSALLGNPLTFPTM